MDVNKVGASSGGVVAVLCVAISVVVTVIVVEEFWESDGPRTKEPGEVVNRVLTTCTRSEDEAIASLLVTSGARKVVCSVSSSSELAAVVNIACGTSESPEILPLPV